MDYAKIIVDLPLMQTDQPYTYHIPSEFEPLLEVGMRVHVPFGVKDRPILGFVVELTNQKPDIDKIKDILEVLDEEPVLSSEQLALADRMRKNVFAYKITLLKSMLPAFLHSNYEKFAYPLESLPHVLRESLFGTATYLDFAKLNPKEQASLMRLSRKGQVQIEYRAEDRQHIKLISYYRVQDAALKAMEIHKRATKRQEVYDYLTTHPEDQEISFLRKKFSSSAVAPFIQSGALELYDKEINRTDALFSEVSEVNDHQLNPGQQMALDKMLTSLQSGKAKPVLLEGVTGSGKTEVYIQLIRKVLLLGKTAIVLVPEISLTPQMTQRFISRFGKQVAILHSGLSNGEKFDEWRKIARGEAKVVVGARSAIFAPLKNIGAIIIDEEHEATYKQDSNPRYHARDVALLRAEYNHALLVLGSATPTLESRARASRGLYDLILLEERANPLAKIPKVRVVDFRDYLGQNETTNYTPPLLEAIRERMERGEQTVLLLNRRGYSSFVMCRECGHVDSCPNCDISLTLHMDTKSMNCHYCGYRKGIPKQCSNCGSSSIRYYGTGTQKAVEELQEIFPQARILRMDVDTTRKKGSHEKMLATFGEGKADILLGTQMIAKGLDFPNVTLVGVLNADTALNLPDFRSSERTFQLLTQVAGRAGRAEKEGEVIIQTYNPEHYAILLSKNQNYEEFYAYEMGLRKMMSYPPYYFTVGITLSHSKEEVVRQKAYEIMSLLRENLSDQVQLLGPTPKPIARTHNLYHYQLLIKYRKEANLEAVLNQILEMTQEADNRNLRIMIDNEPQNFM